MLHEAWIQPESQDPEAMSNQVEQSMDHQSYLLLLYNTPKQMTELMLFITCSPEWWALRQSWQQHAAELASVGASIVVPSIPISPAASPVLPGTTLNARALTFLARI